MKFMRLFKEENIFCFTSSFFRPGRKLICIMSQLPQQELGSLFLRGRVEEVQKFLKENPSWDAHKFQRYGATSLHKEI